MSERASEGKKEVSYLNTIFLAILIKSYAVFIADMGL